jgi:hypothetical protein
VICRGRPTNAYFFGAFFVARALGAADDFFEDAAGVFF